ncbi:MAG: hypothetical protein AMJ93_12410 [Anaerolineae bacterium SM23_84]|nr:MAG: hypothetical protein AMJ93_12410 [Anaerolineae bacterium SM23_84]
MASVFAFLFVRRLARKAYAKPLATRAAGTVAALTFTYAGYLTSFPVQQITILETSVWLPLVLLLLDRALEHGSWKDAMFAGGALACAILAGHPQTTLYLVYATLAYGGGVIWSGGIRLRGSAAAPSLQQRLGMLLGSLVVAGALSAVQLLPSLAFIAASTRAGLGYAEVAHGFSLPELTHLLYPGYFGGSPQYVGILPMVLAAAGLVVARPRRQVGLWAGVAVVALLLAMGGNTFLYSAAHLLAPGFSLVRNQERIVYLFSFAASVLAGLGTAGLASPLPRNARQPYQILRRWLRGAFLALLGLTAVWYYGSLAHQDAASNPFTAVLRHHVLVLILLLGALGVLALRQRRRRMVHLALVLIALNLFSVNGRYNLSLPPAGGSYYPSTGLVDFLRVQKEALPGPFRISSAGTLPGGASAASVYALEDITANTPLRFHTFERLEQEVDSWRRWQLLNVRYVLDSRDLDGPGLERVYEAGEVRIYRMGDPLPRIWFAQQMLPVASEDAALAAIQSPAFDPKLQAVVQVESSALEVSEGGGVAHVVEHAPGWLTIEAETLHGGLLVISQVWDAGWQAELNGERVPLLRTDFLLQGLSLPAGAHRVELAYQPSPLRWGSILSLGALVVWLVTIILVSRESFLAKHRF